MAHLDTDLLDRKALSDALEIALITAVHELTPEAFRRKLVDRLIFEIELQAERQR